MELAKRGLFVCIGLLISHSVLAVELKQPSKWFSIPAVGITEIKTYPDGIEALGKGTIAYKNKLMLDRLEFDISIQHSEGKGFAVLFQLNKERRDSSIDDHHLHGFNLFNRGYGVMFYTDGTVALVKTTEVANPVELLRLDQRVDLTHPVHLCITQEKKDDQLTLALEINRSGKKVSLTDELSKGFDNSGFIGLTLYSGRGIAAIRNLSFAGVESDTDLGQQPRPLYMADYFKEANRSLVHWRYDEWSSDVTTVRVETPSGELLDMLCYPRDYWVIPLDSSYSEVVLRTINLDGHTSVPVKVHLKDDRADYYSQTPQQRVVVKAGSPSASFCLKESGDPFFIKGFNYVRLRHGDHSNFEADTQAGPAAYDPYDTESMLKRLKKYGYNTTRVFIVGRKPENPGISGFFENDGVYAPYMDNFLDFVRRAKKYGIYVFPTLCDGELPRSYRYWDIVKGAVEGTTIDDVTSKTHNLIYLTRQGHQARCRYAKDFLEYIKAKDSSLLITLLALQCQNELTIQGCHWPFDSNEGTFQGPDGKSYDLSVDAQRQALFENSLNAYHTAMVEAVKEVDPDLLVAEGMYVPRIAGKDYDGANFGLRNINPKEDRCPPKVSSALKAPLDFADVHIYYVTNEADVAESYRKDMISTGLYSDEMKQTMKSKPFFLGEFGSFKFMDATFEQAKSKILTTRDLAMKDMAQGYLMWTFDTFEQRSLWHAMEEEAFLGVLSK